MKKLISKLLIFILLCPPQALAALSQADKAFYTQQNLLTNPGAEASTAGVVASTPAHLTTTTAAAHVDTGNASFAWSPTGASETLTFGFKNITSGSGLSGANGVVSCRFQSTNAVATHTIQGWDGTNKFNALAITGAVATGFQRVSQNVIFPASGNITLQLTSGAADTLYIDNCYLGLADGFNLSQVSQAQLYGTIAITGCSFSTASGTYANLTNSGTCSYVTTGNALAPSGNTDGIKFSSLPPGEYLINQEGAFFDSGTGSSALFKFSDGTNTSREDSVVAIQSGGQTPAFQVPSINHSIGYTTAQSNVTLQLQAKAGGSGTANVGSTIVIKVYYFPTQSQTAVNSNQIEPSQYSHTGVTGYGSTNTTVLRLTNNTVSVGQDITYATSSTLGDSWTINTPGMYAITGAMRASAANYVQIGRNLSGTQLTADPAGGLSSTGDAGFVNAVGLISGQPVEFGWTGYLAQNDVIRLSATAGMTFSTTNFTIAKVQASQGAPIIVNSVTSNSAGAERIERATVIQNAASSSVSAQSGNWLSFGSYTSPKTTYTISSGFFSATPTCTCTPQFSGAGITAGSQYVCNIQAVSSTSLTIITSNLFNAEAFTSNFNAAIHCMGPR